METSSDLHQKAAAVSLDGSMRPDAEVSLVSHLHCKLLARIPSDSLAIIRPERREGASAIH